MAEREPLLPVTKSRTSSSSSFTNFMQQRQQAQPLQQPVSSQRHSYLSVNPSGGGEASNHGGPQGASRVMVPPDPTTTYSSMLTSSRATLHYARLRAHRVFALLSLFDMLFSFLLWALVSGGFHGEFEHNYLANSVTNYQFRTSLFDIVGVACLRCLLLIAVYWFGRSENPYTIIFTTAGSTSFLLVKVFFYSFDTKHPTDYLVFIAALTLPWSEAWMYSTRISALDKDIALFYQQQKNPATNIRATNNYRSPSIHTPPSTRSPMAQDYVVVGRKERSTSISSSRSSGFATPDEHDSDSFATPETGSLAGDLNEGLPRVGTLSEAVRGYHLTQQNVDLSRIGADVMQTLWELANSEHDWVLETNKNGVTVRSRQTKFAKIMKAEGYVSLSPEDLCRTLHRNDSQMALNPDIKCFEVIETVDRSTDITYSVTSDLLGGLISPRDFLCVRQVQRRNEAFLLGYRSCIHPLRPELNGIVRADSGPGGYVCFAVEGQPHVTRLVFLVNSNFKGFLPQSLIDSQLSGIMVKFYETLRGYIELRARGGAFHHS